MGRISLKDAIHYVSIRDGQGCRKEASFRTELDGKDVFFLTFSTDPHMGMTDRVYRFTVFVDGKASVGGIIS